MNRPDRITCEETFRRLDDFLDRELSADEVALVRDHLATCAACAAEYEFEEQLLRSVRDRLRRLPAPPDLMERISRRLRESEEPGPKD